MRRLLVTALPSYNKAEVVATLNWLEHSIDDLLARIRLSAASLFK